MWHLVVYMYVQPIKENLWHSQLTDISEIDQII